MMDQEAHKITCPFCWQILDVLVDPSVDEQQYTEDCQVCCNPILITVATDMSGERQLSADPE